MSEEGYLIQCAFTNMSPSRNRGCRRQVTPAEAAWIEKKVADAIADPDDATWRSLPGGDTMSVSIMRERKGDVSVTGKPMQKYMNLLNALEKLAQYGSIQEGAPDA